VSTAITVASLRRAPPDTVIDVFQGSATPRAREYISRSRYIAGRGKQV
jgi:hypothetical protein